MPAYTLSESHTLITLQTAAIELQLSRDDGGLHILRRLGGPNVLGYGTPQPAVDVKVGIDGAWLADRVFVRYLRHSVAVEGETVILTVMIGIGPLMISDRYRITGTLITRTVVVHNVSEDEIRLRGLRLSVPWVRIGDVDGCRFEAPGTSVRSRLALSVAAAQRRGVLPRRFFAPGLRQAQALEPTPLNGPGLMAAHDPQTNETLLCWFGGTSDVAQPLIDGNGSAVTFMHDIHIAERLHDDQQVTLGSQYLLLVQEPWAAALAAYRRTVELINIQPPHQPVSWASNSAIFETFAGQYDGFHGLIKQLDELHSMGIGTICLLPIWSFMHNPGETWNEEWETGEHPYAVLDFARIDPSLGTEADLEALIDALHQRGMRLIIDLPLIGCATNSPYVAQHPDWFCQDETGGWYELPERPGVCVFDWNNQELRDFWQACAYDHIKRYRFDGYRATLLRSIIENWGASPGCEHRGSMLAVLDMIEQLRNEMRAMINEPAVIHTFAGPAAVPSADLINHEQAHLEMFHLALGRVSPAELGQWLEDEAALRCDYVPRIGFTQSYDTWQINPLANGMRGSLLSKCLLTGLILCGFVPMIRSGHERDEYVQRLLRARAANPVLRYGTTQYNSLPNNSAAVFTVLRSYQNSHMIGVLHLSAQKHRVTFSLPVDRLELDDVTFTLFDAIRGKPLREHNRSQWRRDELLALELTLEPFTAYALLLLPVEQTVASPETGLEVAEEPLLSTTDH